MAILCQGCGLDLTSFHKNRVNIGSDSKTNDQASRIRIVAAWEKLSQELAENNAILNAWSNKMCKPVSLIMTSTACYKEKLL